MIVRLKYKKFKDEISDEPLWVFVILSPIIYVVFTWIKLVTVDPSQEITEEELLGRIAQSRQLTYQQANTFWLKLNSEDQKNLLKQYTNNKLLTLKAFELGLDKGDTVIEGRLAQKMRMIILKDASPKKPKPHELESFYNNHHNLYQDQKRYAFSYTIDHGININDLPNTPRAYGNYTKPFIAYNEEQEISRISGRFGKVFTNKLDQLTLNKWHGPIQSKLANHWVYLHSIKAAYLYPYTEVKPQVLRDFRDDDNEKNINRYINELKDEYRHLIKIDDK